MAALVTSLFQSPAIVSFSDHSSFNFLTPPSITNLKSTNRRSPVFKRRNLALKSALDKTYSDEDKANSELISSLKLKLLSTVSGLNRGLAASEEDLQKAGAAAKEVEAVGGPVDLSFDIDKLQGRWKLIYSSAFSSRTLGGSRPGPPTGRLLPITLRQVFQRIDIVSKDFDNIVELELGAPWPLPPAEVTATLAHKFEIIGSAKIRITFEKTTVKATGNLFRFRHSPFPFQNSFFQSTRKEEMSVPGASILHLLALTLTIQYLVVSGEFFKPFNVSYDHRALIIDGKRRMLISAGIHYPRATAEMWPNIIEKSKEGGADVIQSYVFWNGHEPTRGQYNFEGRYDLVKFVRLVGSSGLYLHLRIGPYVCAEWNFGGFPVWLRDVPGIEFRTDNTPFKEEMQRFVKKIVDLLHSERLFCWQGGPIIMLQIENEYGNVESSFGKRGKEYIKWAAKMALGLGAGVPWVMCQQKDAPESIINACNGYYCDGFRPNSPSKPALWTENWDGWFTSWGERVPHRPVEDLAFSVARFFQRTGSFQNYYMYFGGTNFGRTSGGPLYITSYDYDSPIDEYGLLREPKWGHLKDLHTALKLCEPALVSADSPQYIKLGPKQEAHVYHMKAQTDGLKLSEHGRQNRCSAFLANIDEHNAATVIFNGRTYNLPAWSVSILPDCQTTVFNTAKVAAQTSIKTLEFDIPFSLNNTLKLNSMSQNELSNIGNSWSTVKEPIGIWSGNIFTIQGILEHLNVTKDLSDYLWYLTRIHVSNDDITFWEESNITPKITIDSARDVLRVFVNGQLAGSTVGYWVKVVQPVHFLEGYNDLLLLSEAVGLQNSGAFIEKDGAGIRGRIKLTGFRNGDIDLSEALWTYQVGLKGEFFNFYTQEETEKAGWIDLKVEAIPSTFTWYKSYFTSPDGLDPVALDLGSMGKGQAWVNGHHIGRYWTLVSPQDGCVKKCDYRGAYNSEKCATNCGRPTQKWYHIPRSWLKESDNLLVIFEETGGNPLKIGIKLHSTGVICSQVSESHFPPPGKWSDNDLSSGESFSNHSNPEMFLHCDDGHTISSIDFVSYGTPEGSCKELSRGRCHSTNSLSVVSKACLGKNSCTIEVSNTAFGGDPCRHIVKTLAVEARCSSTSDVNLSA